jgi:manganese/zinc/iron transport system permease protein
MFAGAIALGILCAVLTEWVRSLGRVESSAALGVVYTTLFAAGLLLLRVAADSVHIDPDCVLYGTIETVVGDTVSIGGQRIPRAAVVNGLTLCVNGLLVLLFYKELRVSSFDPGLATALGINARRMHYALMGVTAATVVAAFESVGSILVIAMLIVPAATAYLLTDRLWIMLVISLVVAAVTAVLGHALAIALPEAIFNRWGYGTVRSVSTAGMMAVAGGGLFGCALLFGPRHGVLSKLVRRTRLSLRIAREDLLGLLYRLDEPQPARARDAATLWAEHRLGVGPWMSRLASLALRLQGQIAASSSGYSLTDVGRAAAHELVRSHRLWESYVARHFAVPDDQLHESAARVEHFIGPRQLDELESELDGPRLDPHGSHIPPAASAT